MPVLRVGKGQKWFTTLTQRIVSEVSIHTGQGGQKLMTSMSEARHTGYSFGGWLGKEQEDVKLTSCRRMERTEMSYGSVPLQSIIPTSVPLRNHTKELKRFSAVEPTLL